MDDPRDSFLLNFRIAVVTPIKHLVKLYGVVEVDGVVGCSETRLFMLSGRHIYLFYSRHSRPAGTRSTVSVVDRS